MLLSLEHRAVRGRTKGTKPVQNLRNRMGFQVGENQVIDGERSSHTNPMIDSDLYARTSPNFSGFEANKLRLTISVS